MTTSVVTDNNYLTHKQKTLTKGEGWDSQSRPPGTLAKRALEDPYCRSFPEEMGHLLTDRARAVFVSHRNTNTTKKCEKFHSKGLPALKLPLSSHMKE